MKEQVIHPGHYNHEGRKECWTEMLELFGPNAVVIFDILSAYKYYYRAGSKDGNPEEQDVSKIKNYMNHASTILISKYAEGTDDVLTLTGAKFYKCMYDILKGANII